MSIEFDENNFTNNRFQSRVILGMPETPKIVTTLIKFGIVKNEKTAGKFLLALVIISFVTAGFLMFYTAKEKKVEYNLSPDVIQSLPEEIQTKIYESKK